MNEEGSLCYVIYMKDPVFTLMLIDDEPADVELFRDACQEHAPGVQVEYAAHGQDALDLLEEGKRATPVRLPALILLDLNMPVMTGHQFLERIKHDPVLRTIPVVILSTSEAMDDIRQAYRNYAGGYLVKPSTIPELYQLVEAVIDYWRETVALPPLK